MSFYPFLPSNNSNFDSYSGGMTFLASNGRKKIICRNSENSYRILPNVKALEESDDIREEFSCYITKINSDKLALKKPILVKLEKIHDDEWVSSFEEAEIFFSGSTEEDALKELGVVLVQSYETLRSLKKMGSLLLKQQKVLEQYIVEKN